MNKNLKNYVQQKGCGKDKSELWKIWYSSNKITDKRHFCFLTNTSPHTAALLGILTWEMLSWHCDTDLTPGSSTLSFRLLDEPLLSGQTVRWCRGCCGWDWADSVLEITSMRPDRAGFFSCSMLSWMDESSLFSAIRSEEICCRSDGAITIAVESLIMQNQIIYIPAGS